MTATSTARQLSQDADDALRVTRALVAVATRSLSEADGVTMPQFRALVILTSRGPTTSGELANWLHVHQSTLTRLVDRLVRKGLVRRVGVEGDRREVRVQVTTTGVDLVEAVSAARRREPPRSSVESPNNGAATSSTCSRSSPTRRRATRGRVVHGARSRLPAPDHADR